MATKPLDTLGHASVGMSGALSVSDQECGRLSEWHCVCAEWGSDALAAQSILAAGFQVFQPRIRIRIPASPNRPARSEVVPAFPGYLFAMWAEDERWDMVKRARGVAGILHQIGSRDVPAIVPDRFMAALLNRAGKQGIIEDISAPDLLPPIEQGGTVRIMAGPLAGRLGLCEWSTDERVALLCEVMGGTRRTTMRRDQVEAVE